MTISTSLTELQRREVASVVAVAIENGCEGDDLPVVIARYVWNAYEIRLSSDELEHLSKCKEAS